MILKNLNKRLARYGSFSWNKLLSNDEIIANIMQTKYEMDENTSKEEDDPPSLHKSVVTKLFFARAVCKRKMFVAGQR